MQKIIKPGIIEGVVQAPPSKSIMQRLCAAALLHYGKTIIHNPGNCEDDCTAIEIIKRLGAKVNQDSNGKIIIKGNPFLEIQEHISDDPILLNCNESGLSMRMFTPIASLSSKHFVMNGTGSLLQRPIGFFDEVLPPMGVKVITNEGKLPADINGPLIPSDISVDGSVSSQFLTGLLFAFSHKATKQVCINVSNLKSTPYIDLTLEILQIFGCNVVNENYKRFIIHPVLKKECEIEYSVEGDWSGASFMLVAGAIAGKVELKGLSVYSKQADKAIVTALSLAGAQMSVSEDSINVEKPFGNRKLKPFQFNAGDCPDLFPPLAALAACCDGISIIEGASRLLYKESNRAVSLQETFEKIGIKIILQDDYMIIYGGEKITGGEVHSFKDHRIAMACSLLGLISMEPVIINDAEVVGKSYPNFFNDLEMVRKK